MDIRYDAWAESAVVNKTADLLRQLGHTVTCTPTKIQDLPEYASRKDASGQWVSKLPGTDVTNHSSA